MKWEQGELVSAFHRTESRLSQVSLPQQALLVESLDADRTRFVAVDADGAWTLVIRGRKSVPTRPALRLSLLSADYGASYELHEPDGVEALRACVVRCTTSNPAIQALFGTLCAALLESLPAEPNEADIEAEVSRWVSLFWRMQMPPRTSVVGLIGELTLLDSVTNLADWVRAWHTFPTDNLDFAFPTLSVEVKATSNQQRVHVLSAYQTRPVGHDDHYFASVIVEIRNTGDRLGDVVADLGERLKGTPESEMLWRSVADVCGSSLNDFSETRYMREAARKSIRFYAADSVPQPVIGLPLVTGVSGIKFQSDFSFSRPAESDSIIGFTPHLQPSRPRDHADRRGSMPIA